MLRLCMDEDSMDEAIIHGLRFRGVDVVTADEVGFAVTLAPHDMTDRAEFLSAWDPLD